MKKYMMVYTALCALSCIQATHAADAPAAAPATTPPASGFFYGDVRYRYESVDQKSFAKDAEASTLRARVGYNTGVWYDLQGAVEMESNFHLGSDRFNDTTNGRTSYPVVADPQGTELNQLWAAWSGLPQTSIKLGRQALNLDNQRFIGTVGWRQLDQTFDMININNASVDKLSLMYGYVWNVNRIFGDDAATGDLNSNSHLLRAGYAYAPWLNAVAYGYLLDFDDTTPALSSQTYGLRFTGETPLSEEIKFFYTLEGATQDDYADNPASYSAEYFYAAPGLKYKGLAGEIGYESLEGNGTSAFQTPLATLHAFNGWADLFLTTPANGLEDVYGKASYTVAGVGEYVDGTALQLVYHDFNAERGSLDYGTEWNAQISKTFVVNHYIKDWTVALKYADYNADGLYADTEKVWFVLSSTF